MGFRGKPMGRPRGISGANKYPLRKVVIDGVLEETLECGHTILKPRDFVGFTNAYRRRCKQCYLEIQKKAGKVT